MKIQGICIDCKNLIEYTLKEKVYSNMLKGNRISIESYIEETIYHKCKYNIEAKEISIHEKECIMECSLKKTK